MTAVNPCTTSSTPAAKFGKPNNDGRTSRNAAHRDLLEPDAVKVACPVLRGPGLSNELGLPDQLFHRSTQLSAAFDDTNLVSAGGLVPAMALAVKTCLGELADRWLTLPGYFGANAGLKVTALVAGMVASADSIDDMALLRHGRMKKTFHRRVCSLDRGIVPAGVHLRPRPPTRRPRRPVAGECRRRGPDRLRCR
ncbi:UNVERIFIED_ORG: hypothetical protein ABIB52_004249 [Arthrobacter sp. UYCu721]